MFHFRTDDLLGCLGMSTKILGGQTRTKGNPVYAQGASSYKGDVYSCARLCEVNQSALTVHNC